MKTVLICGKAGSGKDTLAEILVRNYGAVSVSQADPIKRMVRRLGASAQQLWGPSKRREEPIKGLDVVRLHKCTANELSNLRWGNSRWSSENYSTELMNFLSEERVFEDKRSREKLLNWVLDFVRPDSTVRSLLQTLGTEFGREQISPNVWIEIARKTSDQIQLGARYDREEGILTGYSRPPAFVVIPDGRFLNEMVAVRMNGGIVVRLVDPDSTGTSEHVSETELDTIPEYVYNVVIVNRKSDGIAVLEQKAARLLKEVILPNPAYFL